MLYFAHNQSILVLDRPNLNKGKTKVANSEHFYDWYHLIRGSL